MPENSPDPTRYAVLLSTMRSGSTLLKALLGSASDVAHLPEVNFQRVLSSERRRRALERNHQQPILLLKRPAWFHETRSYPQVPPGLPVRRVILIRDVYETVRSVGRMIGGRRFDRFPGLWGQRLLARRYWAPVIRNLLAHRESFPTESILVRYESLLENPEEETSRIFSFLGSNQGKGVREYSSPESKNWKWGRDDGSARIRTREVQSPRKLDTADERRKAHLENDPIIRAVRLAAGYGLSDRGRDGSTEEEIRGIRLYSHEKSVSAERVSRLDRV